MEGAQRGAGVAQDPQQVPVTERTEGRHGQQVAVDVGNEIAGEVGQSDGEPADAPPGAQSADAGAGVELARQRPASRVGAEQHEVDGGAAIDADDQRRPPQPARRRTAEQAQRVTQAVAQRIQPEVFLERRQGVGERLGQRPGTVERTARRAVQRGDRARLQQAHGAAVVDRPLDVLRAAGESLQAHRHRRERPEVAIVGPVATGRLDAATLAGQRRRPTIDLAADEAIGPAAHGGDDDAVGALGDRIGAEHDAAPRRREVGLDEHRHLDAAAAPWSPVTPSFEARTSATASTKASQPRTSSLDTKRPAMELVSPSSLVADERTTSAVRPSSLSARHA